ncbi:MAG: CTP synthase [Candidatus Micrarchaeaceae archaeon]
MQTKFVVILGSLMSGMGKGIVTSSILKMLQLDGLNALPVKFDGYLNYDCGTMNPYRHGEVFVLDDGSEVDMDFGMYERFMNRDLKGKLSITGGKVFSSIIEKERRGDYLGEDVQMIPHTINNILDRIYAICKEEKPDVLVIEVGGTVGDIENSYFVEAMRQLSLKEKVVFVNLTYVPKIDVVGEQKTKPTQIAFRMLMGAGIKPDFIVARSEQSLENAAKRKISMFTSVKEEHVIDDATSDTIYKVPLHFIEQGFNEMLLQELGIKAKLSKSALNSYRKKVSTVYPKGPKLAIVGKYVELKDSYASVKEAIVHSGLQLHTSPEILWLESAEINESNVSSYLSGVDGLIVPGGFGKRGIEGMITAIKYARENRIPFLGLCLGMQTMAIEFARNVCNLKGANSTEFDPNTKHKVVYIMPSQKRIDKKGGTMRLGAWKCIINDRSSIAYKAYRSKLISERHRHRYEINEKYVPYFEKNGAKVSGRSANGSLVEILEWKGQFGIGTQAHPELKSRLEAPAPLFTAFLSAAISHSKTSR